MRTFHKILSTAVLSLAFLSMMPDIALACRVRPIEKVLNSADLIFEGHLIRYTAYPDHPRVKVFKIDEAWSSDAHFVEEVHVAETGIIYQENSPLPDVPVEAEKVIWALSKRDIKEIEGTEVYVVPHCDGGMYSLSEINLIALDKKFPGKNVQ